MNSIERVSLGFIMALLALLEIILWIVLWSMCKRKPLESAEVMQEKITAKSYPLTAIDSATDAFNPRRVIAKGRISTMYEATMADGELVVVKRIHPSLVLMNGGLGFSTIVKKLSTASHPNIVSILGFSQWPGERIIVMERVASFVSLHQYLHEKVLVPPNEWSLRLKIAAGAARGLQYLHESIIPNIVHGSVKSSHVLLDDELTAKVSGYGLWFLAPQEKKKAEGYEEPCKESDVYGFGVILLEILTGRRDEDGRLVNWALPLIRGRNLDEVLDPRLTLTKNSSQAARFAKVASSCVSNSRETRPTIGQVTSILTDLEGCLDA